ncbi:MAG: nitroreductase family protein [Methanomassiliicoccaceae archaeon]|jgi:nitroreductase|nr:nitroreductase family protein [Methanomassiliicoccaceae archaeon]
MASNPILENIYARRSVRSFEDRPVREEDINELIKAGFHAANGLNLQKLRFSVVTSRTKLNEYSATGKRTFLEYMAANDMTNPHLESNLRNDGFDIFYGAPAAIFIYAAPGIMTATEDASLAAGNIMLAAASMGLGTCWIGFAYHLGSDKVFLKDNKVPEGHKLLAAIILGYPKNKDQMATPRERPHILNWVR